MANIIRLKSSDGKIFETEKQIAKCSGTIKTMLEGCGMEDGDDDSVVPLPNVNSAILKKVLEFATFHKDDTASPIDDETKERENSISSWDAEFLKVDQGTIFDLILAANYLDMMGLLEATCKTVANMMKGKTADEIPKIINIKNDFTAAEEEQIRKENEWCEEK